MIPSNLQSNFKKTKYHFILLFTILSLITLKETFVFATDEITVTNTTGRLFSEIEDLEDDVIEHRSNFEDRCVREAGSSIALPTFIYTYYNLKIKDAKISADRFSFSGPFQFQSSPTIADASNGKFTGQWQLFDSSVFTNPLKLDFVAPTYTVENGYIQGVVIKYYNVPPTDGTEGACPSASSQDFCPNAWNSFVSDMDALKTAINANSPTPNAVSSPTKLFSCIEYKYVPKPTTSETTGAFIDSYHSPFPLSVPPVSSTGSSLPLPQRDLTKY